MTILDVKRLIKIPKYQQEEEKHYTYPNVGGIEIPLISADKREEFILDIWKGKISLKAKYQTRVHKTIVLVRLDLNGPPHRNPDGEEVGETHIHIYREEYGDKWAYPVDIKYFPNINDLFKTLDDFMKYCNIRNVLINKGLF
jgi:hypothetical protein